MRTKPILTAMPWRSFAFAAVGMAVVVGGSLVISNGDPAAGGGRYRR